MSGEDENGSTCDGGDLGEATYTAVCEQLHINRVQRVIDGLATASLNLKYRCLGPLGAKALAAALSVSGSIISVQSNLTIGRSAVAHILYMYYSRGDGEWTRPPRSLGSRCCVLSCILTGAKNGRGLCRWRRARCGAYGPVFEKTCAATQKKREENHFLAGYLCR